MIRIRIVAEDTWERHELIPALRNFLRMRGHSVDVFEEMHMPNIEAPSISASHVSVVVKRPKVLALEALDG